MSHIALKFSKEIKFDTKNLIKSEEIKLSQENKKVIDDYKSSTDFAEEYNFDIILQTEDSLVFGFDFLDANKKLMLPEINPVTIYFLNATMSTEKLSFYKSKLIEKAKIGVISPHSFGDYFSLAFNCIINLQSALETFLNKGIEENNYIFYNKNQKKIQGNIHDKIDVAFPEIFNKNFKNENLDDYNNLKYLIHLRNSMIHLKPEINDTNTKYKVPYRRIIECEFDKLIQSVGNYLNFYEENIIELCDCENNFALDIVSTIE